MEAEVKRLLDEALFIYENAPTSEKPELVRHVREHLKKHKDALKYLGIGLQPDMVKAGKLFLTELKNRH